MSIVTLMIYIAIAALMLTAAMIYLIKNNKSMVMSFVQNFAGLLFVFSGWVKAVDPMGTAIKMEDYFAEFNAAFADSALSFLAPMFPFLSQYSLAVAIFMIIFEIVLGIMLIMGDRPKLTAWLFFLLVIFFTILTGYTYLTGFVPLDSTFFKFSTWSEFKATNMRVTDCGCFGDFIKLDPRVSFFKDIFLLMPSLYFIFKWKDMHQVFSQRSRNMTILAATIFLILYCVYNFHWNEPHVDFRPFKNGANIAAIKKTEIDAANAVQVIAQKMKNKKTGEIKDFEYADYMKNLATITEEWETIEQIKTEPTIKETKISHFHITDFDGEDKTDMYLANAEPHVMIPIYKASYEAIPEKKIVKDSIFTFDTIAVAGIVDSFQVVRNFKEIKTREIEYYKILWDQDLLNILNGKIKSLVEQAGKENVKTSFVISGIDDEKAKALTEATGINAEIFTADEKLLKTIMRSNPGIILWKNGVLLHKWHYKKLPDWATIKSEFLK
jgi:uncharacterized membrane protein YphA (DoxX/SURF4 family)